MTATRETIEHDLNNWPCKVVIEHKGKRVETIGVILSRGKFCVIRHDNPLLRNIEFATVTVKRLLDELGYVKYADEANYRLAIV